MKKRRLIIHARYWNDIEWLAASLMHIDCWAADKVVLCEGNWDPAWPARSIDGTREMLEQYASERDNTILINNDRTNTNYRINQARTANMAMKLVEAKPDQDWMMTVDVDHFYFRDDICQVKYWLKENHQNFDYLVQNTACFFFDEKHCEIRLDNKGTKLPYKLLSGSSWRPTCHLHIGGKAYTDLPQLRGHFMPILAMHYEGLREPGRLHDKYAIGNRIRFDEYHGGKRMKSIANYHGPHPIFAHDVLKSKGLLND